jgi:hypothetical protein
VTAWACTLCGDSGASRPELVEHAGDAVDLEADVVQPLTALLEPRCDRAGPMWLNELHLVSARDGQSRLLEPLRHPARAFVNEFHPAAGLFDDRTPS